jgi:PleD family two-component response regulator
MRFLDCAFSNSGGFASMSLIRVLIVDDFEYWRLFVSSMLQADPSFEIVFQASDGLNAFQAAEKLQPTVVLLDIGLPGLDGITGRWTDPQGCALRQNSVREHGT